MANPAHFLSQPSPGPSVPVRLAVVGPPKAGKSSSELTSLAAGLIACPLCVQMCTCMLSCTGIGIYMGGMKLL